MKDEQWRVAYQRDVSAVRPASRASCPSPERLAELAHGVNGREPDHALLQHVFSCASCEPEFALLSAIARADTGDAAASPVPSRRSSTVMWRRVALAAVLLVAVGVTGDLWRRAQSPVLRAAASAGGEESDVRLVAPLTGAASTPVFVWRAVRDASVYDVDWIDTRGRVLFTRSTSDTMVVLDDAAQATLMQARTFDWMVTARRVDGNTRRSVLTRIAR
ncbi:MAG: hypothetical protein IT353_11885 [Gemmatimonadaceae bacterium]|nr:hypothetical protein [Gemmatimonadaceae bacterium]